MHNLNSSRRQVSKTHTFIPSETAPSSVVYEFLSANSKLLMTINSTGQSPSIPLTREVYLNSYLSATSHKPVKLGSSATKYPVEFKRERFDRRRFQSTNSEDSQTIDLTKTFYRSIF